MKVKDLTLKHQIIVDALSYRKLNYVVKKYKNEFTALMHSERDGDTFRMKEIFFPNQINTATKTEFESEDIVDLMTTEGFDIVKGCGHMHSHASMSVFSSGTDFDEIVERAETSGYNVAIIMNKKEEIFGHIADTQNGIYVEDVPIYYDFPFSNDYYEEYKMALIKECKTLKEVEDVMIFDEWFLLEEEYPFTQDEKNELDSQIKLKFKERYASYTSNNKSNKANTQYTKKNYYNEYDNLYQLDNKPIVQDSQHESYWEDKKHWDYHDPELYVK